jgi:sporulation protein YlmC with PRC-barrel domain
MIEAKDLYDKEVIGRSGTHIGKVENVLIDPNSWQVVSLRIKLEGSIAEEFGMKKHFRSTLMPLTVDHVQGVSDRVVLKLGAEDLLRMAASAEHAQETVTPPPDTAPPSSPESR